MSRRTRRLISLGTVAAALGLLVCGPAALGQSHGGGSIIFTARRPPRDMIGNIRGWAQSNRATSYNEDTAAHSWRVNFMVFLPRPPNAAEVTLAWFHVDRASHTSVYVSNEPIALTNPTDRQFFYTTSLHRGPGEFEPMENYEAVISVNDSRGTRELARGRIGLVGQVERHSGVVDFTGSNPTAN